jgi:hypothetical protein
VRPGDDATASGSRRDGDGQGTSGVRRHLSDPHSPAVGDLVATVPAYGSTRDHSGRRQPCWLARLFAVGPFRAGAGSVGVGTLIALEAVWNFAEVTMALMALTNLVAILLIGKWAVAARRSRRPARRRSRSALLPRRRQSVGAPAHRRVAAVIDRYEGKPWPVRWDASPLLL